MEIRDEDIQLMIMMENLIGVNEKKLFGRTKRKNVYVDGVKITFDDFVSYINLVDRLLKGGK